MVFSEIYKNIRHGRLPNIVKKKALGLEVLNPAYLGPEHYVLTTMILFACYFIQPILNFQRQLILTLTLYVIFSGVVMLMYLLSFYVELIYVP